MSQGVIMPKPLHLTHSVGNNWRRWRVKFEIFLVAIGHDDKHSKRKTGVLLNVIGD